MESIEEVEHETLINGMYGLDNLGNTCYLNSIIQTFANIELFKKFLLNNTYLDFFMHKLDQTQTQLPYNEVDCATTENISMSYSVAPIIDGFQMTSGSSILIKDQTVTSSNGVYTLFYSNGSYSFVRANFNTASSVRIGFLIKRNQIDKPYSQSYY